MAISRRLLNEGESVVVSTRTHWKALIVPALVLLVCVVASAFAAALDTAALRYLVWLVALVLVVWWSVRPFLRWVTSAYTLTSRRLITRQGIFTRTGHDIPLNRISDVSYEHGITRPDARVRHADRLRRQQPRVGSSCPTSRTWRRSTSSSATCSRSPAATRGPGAVATMTAS